MLNQIQLPTGRLQNKIAVITGGARGIGKATAELFAREGATVVIWDILIEGRQVQNTILESGGQAFFQKVSVTDKLGIEEAVKELVKKFKKIDILINNAGITRDKSLAKMNSEEWSEVLDVNLTGIFNCVKAIVPLMKIAGYGRIVSASSIVGIRGSFGQTNYAASKAGIVGMSKVWTMELSKYGITVNTVAPGYIDTEMTTAIPEDVKKSIQSRIPSGRVGTPDEVANAYLFLASNEASYINGICLNVDGGMGRY